MQQIQTKYLVTVSSMSKNISVNKDKSN